MLSKTRLESSRGLQQIRFRFTPNESWRIVYVLFDLDGPALEDTFHALSLSSIPEVSSTFQTFENGRVVHQTVLEEIHSAPAGSNFSLQFQPGQMEVQQDGVPSARIPFSPEGGPVRMAFCPNKPVGDQRRAYGVLSGLEFETANGEDRTILRPWSPWVYQWWARGLLFLLVVWLVFQTRHRFPRLKNTFYTLAGLFLLFTMGFLIYRALFYHMRDWTEPYFTDRIFDIKKFMAADSI